MFADPQSVTVNAVAQSLVRIGSTAHNQGRFRKSDGSYVLTVSHVNGKRDIHKVRLDHSKIITDPLATDRNLPVGLSVKIDVDAPLVGYTNAEIVQILVGVADWLKASSNSASDKLVGNEI